MKRVTVRLLSLVALAALFVPAIASAASNKPRIAVLRFVNKSNAGDWWGNGGAEAMQDVFVTELVKSGRFRVIDRERLDALMREKNLSLSGDVDPATAVKAGKLLGVNYFLTGAVTEYGATEAGAHGPGGFARGHWLPSFGVHKKTFVAAANARLINAETGEIVWADEARGEDSHVNVSVGGFGGGVNYDQRMFDKVMKPVVGQLVASLKAADL